MAGNSATYSVRLVDVNAGGEAITLVAPTSLAGADDWRNAPAASIDPNRLVLGHGYRILITTTYVTGTSAFVTGSADYDNVLLRAGDGRGSGGGGQAAASAAKRLLDLLRNMTPGTATLKAKRLFVRVRCPRKAGRACRITSQGLLRKGRPATTKRTVKVRKGKAKLVVLRVKPKARRKVAKRKRLLVRHRVRAGRVGAIGAGAKSCGRMNAMRKAVVFGVALLAMLPMAGCGGNGDGGGKRTTTGLPRGAEPVDLNPAEFTVKIDNPYWPMKPGSRWVYREKDGEGGVQRVVVTVTEETKRIANGIEARAIHDVVSQSGEPVEVTDDWYAQDAAGNVWYMGERTAEYEDGKVVSTAGSWEAGVDGAQPGVIMPAEPRPGLAYRQEYYAGEAEDRAKVLSVDEQVEVPFGHFTEVVLTKDLVPLEPEVLEYKLYARGVGPVLVLDVSGAAGREELIEFTEGA